MLNLIYVFVGVSWFFGVVFLVIVPVYQFLKWTRENRKGKPNGTMERPFATYQDVLDACSDGSDGEPGKVIYMKNPSGRFVSIEEVSAPANQGMDFVDVTKEIQKGLKKGKSVGEIITTTRGQKG